MATFQCGTCKHIAEFMKRGWELADEACPKCKKIGGWKEYTGPLSDFMIDREDARFEPLKKEVADAKQARDTLKSELDGIQKDVNKAEHQYNSECKDYSLEQIKMAIRQLEKKMDAMVDVANRFRTADEKYTVLSEKLEYLGNREGVRKDAPKVFDAAHGVGQSSGENKLYIGNRQYVSRHGDKSMKKKLRILDVPNWSPGLNVSWVEGGISAKARFKLKLNESNAYANIPDDVLQKFKDTPRFQNADEFLAICRTDGKGSLLWYNKNGENRPSWTALEIWVILRAGYRFTFSDSKHDGAGRKIVLMPPMND